MPLALFDLDNTLLAGDSDYLWGQYLVEQGLVDGEHYERENQRFYDLYKAGKLNIYEFAEFAYKPLAKNELVMLQSLHQTFMEQKIRPIMTQASIDLVEKHRQQGDTLLIITATNSFVTGPIARAYGVDNLLATEPESVDGRFTGKISGIPCFQEGKVKRLEIWLHEHDKNLDNSSFYSDSHNDLPLLKIVSRPVAVDPDDELKAYAKQRHWPIISLR